MQRVTALAVLALSMVVATGCEAVAGLTPPATPRPCEQLYNARRCLAMADDATAFSEKTRDDVASIVILPDPTPEIGPDGVILQTTSGSPIYIRVVMRDGTTRDTHVCVGVSGGPACVDAPSSWDTDADLIGSGYHDVPEGATPVPSIDPAIAGGGVSIDVPTRTIVIDHTGPYEVPLGTGSLPNGLLTEATYRLADPWPVDVTFAPDATPRLELRSLEPDGKPFSNAYEHGWRDGLERIEAVMVFEVKRFDPGATVEVRDVAVR
jgi:hypothetical protein